VKNPPATRNAGPLPPQTPLSGFGCSSTPEQSSDESTASGTPETTTGGSEDMGSAQAPDKAVPQDLSDAEMLAQDAERLDLKQQKTRFQIETHLAVARALRDELRYEEAKEELRRAIMLDPDNNEVEVLYNEILAFLGEAPASALTLTAQINQEYELRVQQLRAEAADHLRRGKLAMSRNDYDAAIAELSLTVNHVRWAPYSIDWQGIDTEAAALLEAAKADRTAAMEAAKESERRETTENLRRREQLEVARREAIVANILTQGIQAFEAADYEEAM
jgi:hypothetical protein